jgi:hypothetical protein
MGNLAVTAFFLESVERKISHARVHDRAILQFFLPLSVICDLEIYDFISPQAPFSLYDLRQGSIRICK